MNKLLIILGMRRSGTSILKRLIESHPEVMKLEFEPHEVIFCCRTHHLNRYKNNKYHNNIINKYKNANYSKYYGFKEVFNPGIEAMNWKWLYKKFPEAKFVFIIRNVKDNYNSWIKQDLNSTRGICSFEMYKYWYELINQSFIDYYKQNNKNSCLFTYEKLVENADKTLEEVWKKLKIPIIKGLNNQIRKPENWSLK